PRGQRGAGERRAEPQVRRGGDGVDPAAPWGGLRGAGAGDLLPGAAGAVQGAALLAVRRDVPHDGDGQDPEVQATPDGRRAARTPRRRGGGDRLRKTIALSEPSAGANLVLAMLPRARAYAAVAGVPPAYGLYAS